jgi:ATP adenylyltransferase/5',5'''-P-1,P-4-tetraphosphate phosphorylase II
MFCPDERLNIVQLNHTHQLALNLFCVDRPQLLMLTLDSYKRQHETLDLDDMKVMLEVLRLFPSFYVLFNCGEQGGCSRVHKHMQGLRGPPHAFRHIMYDDAELPYKHFARYFIKGFKNTSAADVFTVYLDEIDACRRAMKLTWRDPCPHNVVMWMDTLIVIPRRKGSYNGVSANTAGMLGSVWVSSMDEMQEWKSIGCSKVLTELGYIS